MFTTKGTRSKWEFNKHIPFANPIIFCLVILLDLGLSFIFHLNFNL